jgi:hypothetical protein
MPVAATKGRLDLDPLGYNAVRALVAELVDAQG